MSKTIKSTALDTGIELYPDQLEIVKLVAKYKFALAYGSSRAGKSFVFLVMLFMRALMYPGSNHCVIRSTAASIPSTIGKTAKDVLKKLGKGYNETVSENKLERCITLHNGSTIWFFGAQDDDAVEKIMGAQFATIFLNEVVNFEFDAYSKIITRLNSDDEENEFGRKAPIDVKLFADCNPKSTSHWVYQQWKRKVVPGTERPLYGADNFGWIALDRYSNKGINQQYYDEFQNQSDADRARFLEGEWYDEIQGAVFSKADLNDNRRHAPESFDLTVVTVDPALSDGPEADETGIIVAGCVGTGEERHYYPIDDLSGRYHPHDWMRIACDAYHQHGAAKLVIEVNQGGGIWEANFRAYDPRVNIVTVRASGGQGKNERAKPIGAMMKHGRIHHPPVGSDTAAKFAKLEAQMLAMTGDYDRKKGKSPDRLDAYVYAISEMLTGTTYKPVVVSKLAGWWC